MSKEITNAPQSGLSIVTRQDVESLKSMRELLKEYIGSQLKEAQFTNDKAEDYGDGDYGVIPGTKKRVLLKPGAEKILQLFNLGARFRLVSKEVDRHENLAMFEYECEIFSRKTNQAIATCIGMTSSQEKKWRGRTKWVSVNGVRVEQLEETPIFDILNTLSKMAQKRALVGATILATAASDFFTQDMEADEVPEKEAKPAPPAPPKLAEAEQVPECCGKPMMISKYPDRETGEFPFFCMKCKSKVPRAAV